MLAQFKARGSFRVKMPLDAELIVEAPGARPIRKELLLDFAPVHKFLWYLESADLGRPETLDRFEALVRQVDLEFPLGYRMPGCYIAAEPGKDLAFRTVRIVDAPRIAKTGSLAPAAILLDKEQVSPGDQINLAALFHDESEGSGEGRGRLVVEDGRSREQFSPPSCSGGVGGPGCRAGRWLLVDRGPVDGSSLGVGRPGDEVGVKPLPTRASAPFRPHSQVTRRAEPVNGVAGNLDHHYGIGPRLRQAGRGGQPRATLEAPSVVDTDAGA